MGKPFRTLAGFGKRIEYWILGQMLREGIDVYVPLVDDDAIDAVIRKSDGSFITVQIKARSKDIIPGDAALFAAIPNGFKRDKSTGGKVEYCKSQFTKYIAKDFSRLR